MISDIIKKPVVVGVMALVVGFLLGLLWAYNVQPVDFYDAPINLLRVDLKEDYMRMTVDSFRVNGDETLAVTRYQALDKDAGGGYAVMQKIKANPGKLDPNAVLLLEDLLKRKGVYNETATTEPAAAGGSPVFTFVLIVIILLVLAGVAAAAFWALRGSGRRGDITPAQQAADFARAVEKTDYAARGETPPVAQYVTTYVLGDDLFDDSFSIDSPAGEFLGECGVGISETIGVGDPKKVTAFEVWMFDKNDIQTVTKVLMSPHAFTDPAFRTKLEAKGELLNVGAQRKVILETQTLQMTATIADMQLGQGALPDGSYFDRITLELAIWSKKAA